MNRSSVFKKLCQIGILPVIRVNKKMKAIRAVEALAKGGISVSEIAMTLPDAIDVIQDLVSQNDGQLTIGAGTVTDVKTCAAAIEAGCQFVVTPIVNHGVINLCRKKGVCIIGGALTPTEIHATFLADVDAVKVFPAKAMGGPAYIQMLREPFPELPLVPTGGVTLETIADFFKAGAPLVGVGGDLVGCDALGSGNMEQVTHRARQYVSAIARLRESTITRKVGGLDFRQ